MKLTVIIDAQREEEAIVYAHEEGQLVSDIRRLLEENGRALLGYTDGAVVPLEATAVCCFTVENNRVYALTEDGKLQVRLRLYQLEQFLPDCFVKINQSCLANVKKIKRFEAAFSGSLKAVFSNGYTDYVSRRNLKNVKERFGF